MFLKHCICDKLTMLYCACVVQKFIRDVIPLYMPHQDLFCKEMKFTLSICCHVTVIIISRSSKSYKFVKLFVKRLH